MKVVDSHDRFSGQHVEGVLLLDFATASRMSSDATMAHYEQHQPATAAARQRYWNRISTHHLGISTAALDDASVHLGNASEALGKATRHSRVTVAAVVALVLCLTLLAILVA